MKRTATGVLLMMLAGAGPGWAAGLKAEEVKQGERLLAALGYWTGPIDGTWDGASRHALVAFQKVEGRKATGTLTHAELAALIRAQPPVPRVAAGPHLEVDITRQVLFLVDAAGRVANVLPISSGNGKPFTAKGWYGSREAYTPCGLFEVYRKTSGWHTSPLGEMHNPMYIVGGIAIHGSESVPAHPASHGCIRIPMFASHRLTSMVPSGTPVHVYGCRDELDAVRIVQ